MSADRWTPQDLAEYQARQPKRNKYRAQPTVIDEIRFASKREATRYQDLKVMEQLGLISGLELQPAYPIIVDRMKVCTYKADFRYIENGALVVEDAKGMKTPVYRLKKKLMKALYGIEIREV